MEVDKQLKFKSHQRMQVEFISNNVDVMTHDCLFSVALAKRDVIPVATPSDPLSDNDCNIIYHFTMKDNIRHLIINE